MASRGTLSRAGSHVKERAPWKRGGRARITRVAMMVTVYPPGLALSTAVDVHDNSLGSIVRQRDGHCAEWDVRDFTDVAKARRPAPVMDRTGRVDPGHDVRHPIGPTVGLNGGHMPSHTCVSGQLYRPDTAP